MLILYKIITYSYQDIKIDPDFPRLRHPHYLVLDRFLLKHLDSFIVPKTYTRLRGLVKNRYQTIL